MQIRTWFGIFTIDDNRITNVELFQKDLHSITKSLLKEPLLMRGTIAGSDLCDLALIYGFACSKNEYEALLHEVNINFAKERVAMTITPDLKIIAAVEAIDDLDETSNLLSERLKEWFIMNFEGSDLKGEELARSIDEIKDDSEEMLVLKSFSKSLLGLYRTRGEIEEYLKETMPRTAPNITNIAGHLLGARLLSITGGLKDLASMPSSTIQVIGAHNALFKHLKGKAPSPKHGVIFRHPLIITAPRWQRGKIARALASKISLAARYDQFSGELNDHISRELMMKVDAIRKQPEPNRKRVSRSGQYRGIIKPGRS
jgi:nucleolar protein 56